MHSSTSTTIRTMPKMYRDKPVVRFRTLDDWCAWLEENHDKVDSGVWMMVGKKGSNRYGINYNDTREGALRYGWIDSLPNKLDEHHYYLKVTPRRTNSIWSKINVGLIETYIEQGLMHPAGMKEVNEAKADGRWDAAY